jgi:tetratricopeptide (TPR) repeat protein
MAIAPKSASPSSTLPALPAVSLYNRAAAGRSGLAAVSFRGRGNVRGRKLIVHAVLCLALMPCVATADPLETDPAAAALDSDYAAGKKAIEAKNWNSAIKSLSSAALRDTRNADIQNYLGYAYRNSGQMDLAFDHYERALRLNPRHRGAHEYLGEAYLMINNLAKAEEHLAALQKICLIPCEEYGDLKKRIDAYRKSAGI